MKTTILLFTVGTALVASAAIAITLYLGEGTVGTYSQMKDAFEIQPAAGPEN